MLTINVAWKAKQMYKLKIYKKSDNFGGDILDYGSMKNDNTRIEVSTIGETAFHCHVNITYSEQHNTDVEYETFNRIRSVRIDFAR